MMLGGGCGRELARWIIHGRPEKDMYGYDIRYINANTLSEYWWLAEVVLKVSMPLSKAEHVVFFSFRLTFNQRVQNNDKVPLKSK